MEDFKVIIDKMVDNKVIQLLTLENVRYEGGRLYYESQNLITELSNFEPDIQIYYLERLQEQIKKRKIIIKENLPRSVSIITDEFSEWLENRLNTFKINSYSRRGNQPNKEPEIYLDYSKNNRSDKIVFLHELGILDYLQDKMSKELHGFSANKLAEIISTFTDIQQATAQPMLNPMFTKDVAQKNNPLTEKNLINIKEKLMNIGFNKTKTP